MSWQMSSATMLAPSRARYLACEAPCPCDAPVTKATLPSSLPMALPPLDFADVGGLGPGPLHVHRAVGDQQELDAIGPGLLGTVLPLGTDPPQVSGVVPARPVVEVHRPLQDVVDGQEVVGMLVGLGVGRELVGDDPRALLPALAEELDLDLLGHVLEELGMLVRIDE